ncbi:MAG: hypothetical protein GWP91_00805 [Rhodobacterales bacterium]|nr:hypothetical protein [Rhodobacterales bacterium]
MEPEFDLLDEFAALGVPEEAEPIESARQILTRAAPMAANGLNLWFPMGVIAAAAVMAVLLGHNATVAVQIVPPAAEGVLTRSQSLPTVEDRLTTSVTEVTNGSPAVSKPPLVSNDAVEPGVLVYPRVASPVSVAYIELAIPATVRLHASVSNRLEPAVGATWIGRHKRRIAPLLDVDIQAPRRFDTLRPVLRGAAGIATGERAIQGQLAWSIAVDAAGGPLRTGPEIALAVGGQRGPKLRLSGGADVLRQGLAPRWAVGVAVPVGRS